MIDVAVMGYGVVGSGVVEILTNKRDQISNKAQKEINLKYILDIRDFEDSPFADKFTKNFEDILNDEDVKVVAELIGGLYPSFEFVKRCLEAGKNVVTSNKELVAKKGAELIKLAKENNVNFLFEASVGGGIPIIRPLTQCLVANDILEITGILNGTTNFILTKMIKEEMSFEDALSLAQELGYAERDPSADIDGDDACRKICILSSLVLGEHIYPEDVFTRGIRNIKLCDVAYADKAGYIIKLIAKAKKISNEKLEVVVEPMFVKKDNQLANVDDVFNAVLVNGDATGDVMFYGKGAGKLPTASAVVADIIDCAKHIKARKYLYWEDKKNSHVVDYSENIVSNYIRVSGDDASKVEEVFSNVQFIKPEKDNEIAFITEDMTVSQAKKKCIALEKSGMIMKSVIRVNK
ncbi:MAG: homoserine dehydrogenase [Clostridia bacterium]|nr:homoserine dehydrogenase [Clostridia bacterium]